MRSRGMVGVVAFGLAAVATLTVFLYVHSVKRQAETGGKQVVVIVSKKDISTGTDLDTMISQGAFTQTTIPAKDEVRGAVTSLQQLKGHRTSVPILAGEQIPVARLQGSTELPGGTLGIPEGYEALTFQLDAPRADAGVVQRGDHVTVFGTFRGVGVAGGIGTDVTATLVPDVKVLRITRSDIQHPTDGVMVTLALRPRDAQKVVYTMENGFVWLGLLPPGQSGTSQPPLTVGQVLK